MAAATSFPQWIGQLRSRTLKPLPLGVVTAFVWLAGALYCSGYELLMSGLDNWPGSLWWSAVAVLPWLALFEWSKSVRGRRLTARILVLALVLIATAAASLLLEFAVDLAFGDPLTPFALAVMRRLPAIGISLLLILWARSPADRETRVDESLAVLAPSIDWVSAADNYVELHLGVRTLMRRMTLREAERALAPSGFIRIHRRYLVRRASVIEKRPQSIRLRDGTELPVGRAYRSNLLG